jgi:hypothetical protein
MERAMSAADLIRKLDRLALTLTTALLAIALPCAAVLFVSRTF